jgi:integrase
VTAALQPVDEVWSESVGSIPHKVTVFEYVARSRVLYLKWRRSGNWKYESLAKAAIDAGFDTPDLTDEKGRRLVGRAMAKKQTWALAQAESKWAKLKAGLPDRERKLEAPLTLGETWPLLIDEDTGNYPADTPHRREVKRELDNAIRILGADMPWSAIKSNEITKLMRTRIRELQEDKHAGLRGAEVTIARLNAIATWLRAAEKIPADAAVVASDWKSKLREDWQKVTKNPRLPTPNRPRHTREEIIKLLEHSWSADPRLGFMLALGIELRPGQVARGMRVDLDLEKNTMRVWGVGKKKGTVIKLTKGQRAAVDRVLHPETGYLRELEAAYQARQIDDYLFFPGGMFHGSRVIQRGYASQSKDPYYVPPVHPAIPLEGIEKRKAAGGTAVRKWFRLAESRAGIPHVDGRALYGPRRGGVDGAKALKISREGLQEWGGWTDSQVPDSIYADEAREYARDEAAGARAKFRGEEE